MLTEAQLHDEEQKIEAMLEELTEAQRSYVETASAEVVREPQEFMKRLRLFFVGWHHFYLNHWVRGSISVALFVYGILGYFIGQYWAPALMLFSWLFELPNFIYGERKIRDRNVTALRSSIGQVKRRR